MTLVIVITILVIVSLLLVGFKSIDVHSLNGAKNASMRGYLGLVPPEAPAHAFRAANLLCLDGQNMPGCQHYQRARRLPGSCDPNRSHVRDGWAILTSRPRCSTRPLSWSVWTIDPRCLKIIQRLPTGWTGMEVNDWPARMASGGASELVKISYQLQRADADKQLELNLTTDRPLDQSRVRLGLFPATTRTLRVTINGKRVNATLAPGGDSCLAWVDWPTGLAHLQIMTIAK